jgi:hypothetical protein
MEVDLDITELLKKFGTIRAIPADDLAAAGYELRRAPDGARYLHRCDAEDPADRLRRKLAHVLGVPESLFAGRSLHFLNRLVLVLDEEIGRVFTDDEGKVVEGRLLDGRVLEYEDVYQSLDPMVSMLRAKAKGELAQLRQNHGEAVDTLAEMSGLGLNLGIWANGIGERFMDSEEGVVTTESEYLLRVGRDLNQALELFVSLDKTRSQGCLKELASHLGCKPAMGDILSKAVADRKALQLAVSTTLKRLAGVRPGKRNDLGVAQFHLKRALDQLKSGPISDDGKKVFRARWSSKDPFDDLLIGNDAGCCIGVYGMDDKFGGAPGKKMIPAMLFDPATQFIELWCGDERVGLALCFACHKDGSPVLVVNSIELSGRVAGHARVLSELALGYAVDLAVAAGFKSVVMGNHGYNTGVSHGRDEWLGQLVKGIVKVHHLTRHVHGDVFTKDDVDGDENDPSDGFDVFGVSEVVMPSPTSARPPANVSAWEEEGMLTFAQAREICEVVIGPKELLELRTRLYGLDYGFSEDHPWRWLDRGGCGFTLEQLLLGIRELTGQEPQPGRTSRVALVALDFWILPDLGDEHDSLPSGDSADRGEPHMDDQARVCLVPLDLAADARFGAECLEVSYAVPLLEMLDAELGETAIFPGKDWVVCRPFEYCFRGERRGDWSREPRAMAPKLFAVSAQTYDDDSDNQHWKIASVSNPE